MGFSEHALNRGLGEALGSGREADLEIGPPGHCLFAVFYLHRQLIRTRITFFLARGPRMLQHEWSEGGQRLTEHFFEHRHVI
jgi:hypothetical protein